jgi:hypothetical protein
LRVIHARLVGEAERHRGVKNTGILLAKIKKLTKTRNLVKFSAKSAFKLYVKFYGLIDPGEANGLLP